MLDINLDFWLSSSKALRCPSAARALRSCSHAPRHRAAVHDGIPESWLRRYDSIHVRLCASLSCGADGVGGQRHCELDQLSADEYNGLVSKVLACLGR